MPDDKTDRPARRPYRAPDLQDLGSLQDLTLTNSNAGGSDGGRRGSNRTR